MQHIEKGDFAGVGFLTYENILKILKKTIRIFDPFSIVQFECLDQNI